MPVIITKFIKFSKKYGYFLKNILILLKIVMQIYL